MSLHKNRVKMTVTGAPGTGTITLSAAVAQYQSLATAYGANATVDLLYTDAGNVWGVERDCSYVHSGTTITRGTAEDGSSGAGVAVILTSAAVVSVIATAAKGTRIEDALLSVVPGGRLTLESGAPVSTTDQTAKTSIYYTPYVHNIVNLWDGTNWVPTTFTEKTLAIGTTTNSLEHNVYGYLSSGALVLEKDAWDTATVTFTNATDLVNWTSTPAVDGDMFLFYGGTAPAGLSNYTTYYVRDKAANSFKLAATPGGAAIDFTTDGTGTITGKLQNIALQDGRYCKNGDKTRLYLGSFYTTTTTTTEDSEVNRYLWNAYNRIVRVGKSAVGTDHTYNTVTLREWNNGAATLPRIHFISGLPTGITVAVQAFLTSSLVQNSIIRAYLNGVTDITGTDIQFYFNSATFARGSQVSGYGAGSVPLGRNYVTIFESENAANANSYGKGITTAIGWQT